MKNIVYTGPMIGNSITIIGASNSSLNGISGKVVNETKNMLSLLCNGRIKKINKSGISIKVGNNVISGRQILKRPEERL
jgi:RNase P/RNase MRP subunit p29